MLKIRLQRFGAAHNPIYRIVVAESTNRRDGRHNEVLGHYAPKARGNDPEYRLNLHRVDYWLSVGATPTDTARSLINRARRDLKAFEVSQAATSSTEESAVTA